MLLKPIQVAAPIWATKHYVWATRIQVLGAQVATKALKSVCSTVTYLATNVRHVNKVVLKSMIKITC